MPNDTCEICGREVPADRELVAVPILEPFEDQDAAEGGATKTAYMLLCDDHRDQMIGVDD